MIKTLKILTVGGAILALTGQSVAQQDIVEDIIERNRPRIEIQFPGSQGNGYYCQTHNRYCNHRPYDDRGYYDRDRDYDYDRGQGYHGDDRGREDRKRWEEQQREDRKRWEEQQRENRKRLEEREREDRKRWEEQQREQRQRNRERQRERWER